MHYCRLYIGDMVEHMWQSMALSGQDGYDCDVGKDQHFINWSIAHIKLSYGKAMAMIEKKQLSHKCRGLSEAANTLPKPERWWHPIWSDLLPS